MSKQQIGICEALRPRAQAIAAAIVARLPEPGLWAGYTADEQLLGELRFADQVNYWRSGQGKAVIVFRDPTMTGLGGEVDWGNPVTVEKNVVERETGIIELGAGATMDDTVSHTFSTTRTLLEQAKVGAELAIRAYAEVYGEAGMDGMKAGGKAGLEISAKLTAEYQRQWGKTDTMTDTVARKVELVGPGTWRSEAERSLEKQQRRMRGRVDFEHTVELIDETGAGERPPRIQVAWPSLVEFMAVARGIAPMDRPLAREFRDDPVADLTVIAAPSVEVVEWLVDYDDVRSKDIRIPRIK